jgi:hypothetical protein
MCNQTHFFPSKQTPDLWWGYIFCQGKSFLISTHRSGHKSTHRSPGSVPMSFEVSKSDTWTCASFFPRVIWIRESKLASIDEFASTCQEMGSRKYLQVNLQVLGIVMGNPGVVQANPHPYPWPGHQGYGFW